MYLKTFTGELIYEILGEKTYMFLSIEHIDFMENYAVIKRIRKLPILLEIQEKLSWLNRKLLTMVIHL